MSPPTVKRTQVSKKIARYLCPILSKFGVSRQIFIKSPPPPIPNFTEIGQVGDALTHAESRANRRTDVMCLKGAFFATMSTHVRWCGYCC